MTNNSQITADDFSDKKVVVLGAARSGLAACRLLYDLGADVTLIDDFKSKKTIALDLNIPQIKVKEAGYNPQTLDPDLLIPSPGIPDSHPLISALIERGVPVYSEVELASRFTQAPIIAVTGSNGKSTVTSMIHEMMLAGGFNSFLGGNIGVPFTANVSEERNLNPDSPVQVVEVSSFQAEHLDRFRPDIAVFLNLSPDHMDRYPNLESYGKAKLQIVRNIATSGWIVYHLDDPFYRSEFESRECAIPFADHPVDKALFLKENEWIICKNQRLIQVGELSLPGPHNIMNFIAAATAANLVGVDVSVITQVMREFKGLPHRLELVGETGKVRYYNDSKATNVAAAKAALESFKDSIILILGGSDKGATDYPELDHLIQERVKQIIAYGQAGIRLSKMYQGLVPILYEREFGPAVEVAHQISEAGDIVLLAPACASFDQFNNYEERGESFRRLVQSFSEETILA
ncbi:UDP-N-acetylmuramoyl-L-alanine--D-glutamate ligase [Candidatus Neomarinimicrobiota bacterium]